MERISLQNDELEGANNVYLFNPGTKTILVDTGEHARKQTLRTALDDRDLSFADIDEIFLTHWHPDHSGLARTIQETSGAIVRIHKRDAPLLTNGADAWQAFLREEQSRLEAWGVPAPKRQQLSAHRDRDVTAEHPTLSSVTIFEDGDVYSVGDRRLEVRHTPGHTAGSVCFVLDGTAKHTTQAQEVITGDTLLPNYTPNVGGSDTRLDRPLEQYLSSLRTLVKADYDHAWPGHRSPIAEPSQRAREIIVHHEQRAGRIIEILHRVGPADVWTVCSELFGDLERFHILVGAGEAYAHLTHLEEQGTVECIDGRYRIADTVSTPLHGDIDRWPLSLHETNPHEAG